MNALKTAGLTLLFVIGFFLPSCDQIDCRCPPIDGAYFDIQGAELLNYRHPAQSSTSRLNPGEEVVLEEYLISLDFQVGYFGFQPYEPARPAFSLMPSALACSCVFNGISGSQESLDEFAILTRNDFDDEHLANDTINDLFWISSPYLFDDPIPLEEFRQNFGDPIQSEFFRLYLQKRPSRDSLFQVDIHFSLDNGESYTLSNEPVIIL